MTANNMKKILLELNDINKSFGPKKDNISDDNYYSDDYDNYYNDDEESGLDYTDDMLDELESDNYYEYNFDTDSYEISNSEEDEEDSEFGDDQTYDDSYEEDDSKDDYSTELSDYDEEDCSCDEKDTNDSYDYDPYDDKGSEDMLTDCNMKESYNTKTRHGRFLYLLEKEANRSIAEDIEMVMRRQECLENISPKTIKIVEKIARKYNEIELAEGLNSFLHKQISPSYNTRGKKSYIDISSK